ncbi:vesicle-associated protein 2-1-like [Aristolochia californica]|uniref:vesicle-associated protein 2-1-like n=1 Tax=Aristolochia californica TaxID=171875 RepID=UPI0035DA51E8
MTGDQLISVHPEELTFQFELEKRCCCDLKIVNNTEHHVAFKVKTTSPRKYFVRPNTGIILPWDNCLITVTLQAQKDYPPDMQCKDKFLLQSTKVVPTLDVDEIPPETFNKDVDKIIEECKLRVVYASPTHSALGNSETDSLITASMLRSSKHSSEVSTHGSGYDEVLALKRVKEERDFVVQQTKQLQHELEILKRRRNRRADAGFSLTFAAFVALTGIMVGFILNLTLSSPSTE